MTRMPGGVGGAAGWLAMTGSVALAVTTSIHIDFLRRPPPALLYITSSFPNVRSAVATSWAQRDPAAAAAWVVTHPQSRMRGIALGTVASNWSRRDPAAAERLPRQLTNQEFWKLITDFSEAGGTFHSDNLVSNEARCQYVMPTLVRTAKAGRAYLGVGPEQNFTYIVGLAPKMAFILTEPESISYIPGMILMIRSASKSRSAALTCPLSNRRTANMDRSRHCSHSLS